LHDPATGLAGAGGHESEAWKLCVGELWVSVHETSEVAGRWSLHGQTAR
jgi:hypothetical protein